MFLKCQPQHSNCFVIELKTGLGNCPVNQVNFLVFIDFIGRFKHLGTHVNVS